MAFSGKLGFKTRIVDRRRPLEWWPSKKRWNSILWRRKWIVFPLELDDNFEVQFYCDLTKDDEDFFREKKILFVTIRERSTLDLRSRSPGCAVPLRLCQVQLPMVNFNPEPILIQELLRLLGDLDPTSKRLRTQNLHQNGFLPYQREQALPDQDWRLPQPAAVRWPSTARKEHCCEWRHPVT